MSKADDNIVPWQVLTVGLPKGNLNRPQPKPGDDNDKNHYRGHVRELFRLARIDIRGYEPGNEETRPFVPGIESRIQFVTAKPQELEKMLKSYHIDMAILGKDSHEEWISGFWECASKLISQEEGFEEEIKFLQSRDYLFGPSFTDKLMEKLIYGEIKREAKDSIDKPMPEDYWDRFDKFIKNREKYWGKVDKFARILSTGTRIPEKMVSNGKIHFYEFLKRADRNLRERLKASAEGKVFGGSEEDPSIYCQDESLEVVDFGLGKTRTAWAKPKGYCLAETIIDSEFPWLTLRELSKVLPRQLISLRIPPYNVEIHRSSEEDVSRIILDSMRSSTELSGYLSVHCVASGRSLRENELAEIGKPIMESTARLYLSPNTGAFYNDPNDPLGAGLHALADPLIKRLKDASIEYSKKYRDSIWHPGQVA